MTTATKLQLGTAALAMAAAAAVTPVVAQADSMAPLAPSFTTFAKALGSTAGDAICDLTGGADCAQAVTTAVVTGQQASAVGDSIFKNNAIWIGNNTLPGPSQNSNFWNDPDTVQVWTFTPLNAVLWAKPYIPGLWTWFDSRSQQTCVLGITTALGGPYSAAGTYTHSYNHKGCNPS